MIREYLSKAKIILDLDSNLYLGGSLGRFLYDWEDGLIGSVIDSNEYNLNNHIDTITGNKIGDIDICYYKDLDISKIVSKLRSKKFKIKEKSVLPNIRIPVHIKMGDIEYLQEEIYEINIFSKTLNKNIKVHFIKNKYKWSEYGVINYNNFNYKIPYGRKNFPFCKLWKYWLKNWKKENTTVI